MNHSKLNGTENRDLTTDVRDQAAKEHTLHVFEWSVEELTRDVRSNSLNRQFISPGTSGKE